MDGADLVHLLHPGPHAGGHAGGVTGCAGGHAAEILLAGVGERSLLAGFDLDRLGLDRSGGTVVSARRECERGEGNKG